MIQNQKRKWLHRKVKINKTAYCLTIYFNVTLKPKLKKYLIGKETLTENDAKSVSITIMNPNNGEIFAMANSPSYNLNKPYIEGKTDEKIGLSAVCLSRV